MNAALATIQGIAFRNQIASDPFFTFSILSIKSFRLNAVSQLTDLVTLERIKFSLIKESFAKNHLFAGQLWDASAESMKILIGILSVYAFAQTQVDLRTQGKTYDFSQAQITKTFRMGNTLPTTCSLGETFLLLSAGNIFYACTSANSWQAPAGTTYQAGTGISLTGSQISVNDAVVPRYSTGTGVPASTCTPGRDFYVDLVGKSLYFCESINSWKTTAAAPSEPGGTGSKTWLLASPGATVAASATVFGFVNGAAGTAFSTSRPTRENIIPAAGTVRDCFLRVNGSQTGNTLTATLMVNGNPAEISMSVPSGSSSGVFSDTVNSVNVQTGDLLSWRLENTAGATSITVISLACQVR